ncbi:hypothetical protein [Hyphococcus sp.]|uniref:hypothetical protein n=1 Tax=Hyphococcus sp. TaxID=2038636 RepID=UPI0020883A22|nr:MAG: hypothetical protein DHS20C04_19230 [Marinicaulis sp.]
MLPNLKLVAAAAGVCAISAVTPATATSLQKLRLDDMVDQSSSVVVGEAMSSRTERTDAGVFTYTDFRVSDAAFGDMGGTVTVTTLGGRYQIGKFKFAETWPGSPHFSAGTRFVLFLQESQLGQAEVVGYSQGAINVVESSDGDSVRTPEGAMEKLPSFMNRVRAMKAKGRAKKDMD